MLLIDLIANCRLTLLTRKHLLPILGSSVVDATMRALHVIVFPVEGRFLNTCTQALLVCCSRHIAQVLVNTAPCHVHCLVQLFHELSIRLRTD